ncbi:MAG: hypothetical protein WAQ25_00505 [Candidatus Saccharimonas sp.]
MKYRNILLVMTALAVSIITAGGMYQSVYAEATPATDTKNDTVPESKPVECGVLPPEICAASQQKDTTEVQKTGVFMLLLWALNIMTVGVGVAAVGALIYAGILYSSAGGGQEQVTKSKKIITDTVIGVVAYALMYLVLNWLIPGGVIG